MRVKPVIPGAVVRDPVTRQPLPAKGGIVPDNVYWTRRLLAGEVEPAEAEAEVEPAATPTGLEPVTSLTTR